MRKADPDLKAKKKQKKDKEKSKRSLVTHDCERSCLCT